MHFSEKQGKMARNRTNIYEIEMAMRRAGKVGVHD